MKLLVVGAGAVGGYFGGRLAEAGADVTFLVRPGRREQLQSNGLCITSPLGDAKLAVKTVVASELRAGYDVALLACKAYDLDSAIEAVAPAMHGDCCLLPLLNGISHFARLDERFSASNVLGGTCSLSVTLLADGTISHMAPLQRLVFGDRGRTASVRTKAFAEVMKGTKVDWELSSNIEQDLWEKIVLLSALAAVTCLFRASIGEIVRAPGGVVAIERILGTNIEIARREGHPPRERAIEFARKTLLDPSSSVTSSMLRDLESGARVESDHVVGWMLDKAREHSLDDTVLSLAYAHLKAYELRRARASARP